MVKLQGENPVSGDSIDATNPREWLRYGIGAFVLVAAVTAAQGGTEMVKRRFNISSKADQALPELS